MLTEPHYLHPDWFSGNIPNFTEIKSMLSSKKDFLEIGCFEGRSTSWILQNMLDENGTLSCVDTFEGSPEHDQMDLSQLEKRWSHNVELARKKTQTCKMYKNKSYDALAQLITEKATFDFIYVDGSHTAPDVLADACMCYGLLRVGGVVLFDDYQWPNTLGELKCPKPGINAFAFVYAEQVQPVISNYQVAFKKIA